MTYIILGVQKGPKETYIICFKAECFENKHTKTFWSKIDFRQFFCLQPILFLCVSFNDVLLVLCLNNLFLCLNIYQHFLLYIHTDLVKKNRELQIRKQMRRYLTGWTLPLLALILIPSQIGITWAPLAIAGLDQGDGQQTRKATLKYL